MSETEKKVIALPNLASAEAEAAAWLAILGREEVSDEEFGRFQTWLGLSDRNRKAYEALSTLWNNLEHLKRLDEIADGSAGLLASQDVPALNRRKLLAAAASTALAIGGGSFVWLHGGGMRLFQGNAFSTAIGERKTVHLLDSSTIQLNTNSQIEVDYTSAARTVRLIRGEAYFGVAKDPRRPFTVFAAQGAIRAVGTAFTVRLRPENTVEVTVQEGRVALEAVRDAARASPGLLPGAPELRARQNAVFGKSVEQILQIDETELRLRRFSAVGGRRGCQPLHGYPDRDHRPRASRAAHRWRFQGWRDRCAARFFRADIRPEGRACQ
jgi:transmembrane sensor